MSSVRRFNGNGSAKRQVPEAQQRRGSDDDGGSGKPQREFAAGSVRISIWVNQSRDNGGQFYSTQIVKRYRESKSGEWKSGNRFNSNELLNLAFLLQEAYGWMLANPLPRSQREPGDDSEEDVESDAF